MKREKGHLADKISVESLTVAIIETMSESILSKPNPARMLEIVDDLITSDIQSVQKLKLYDALMNAYKGNTDYVHILKSEISEELYDGLKQNKNIVEQKHGSITYLSMKIAKDA